MVTVGDDRETGVGDSVLLPLFDGLVTAEVPVLLGGVVEDVSFVVAEPGVVIVVPVVPSVVWSAGEGVGDLSPVSVPFTVLPTSLPLAVVVVVVDVAEGGGVESA